MKSIQEAVSALSLASGSIVSPKTLCVLADRLSAVRDSFPNTASLSVVLNTLCALSDSSLGLVWLKVPQGYDSHDDRSTALRFLDDTGSYTAQEAQLLAVYSAIDWAETCVVRKQYRAYKGVRIIGESDLVYQACLLSCLRKDMEVRGASDVPVRDMFTSFTCNVICDFKRSDSLDMMASVRTILQGYDYGQLGVLLGEMSNLWDDADMIKEVSPIGGLYGISAFVEFVAQVIEYQLKDNCWMYVNPNDTIGYRPSAFVSWYYTISG